MLACRCPLSCFLRAGVTVCLEGLSVGPPTPPPPRRPRVFDPKLPAAWQHLTGHRCTALRRYRLIHAQFTQVCVQFVEMAPPTQLVLPTQRAGSWDVTWGGGGGGARVAGSVGRLANGFGSKGEIAGMAAVKRLRLQVLWWVAVLWWGN